MPPRTIPSRDSAVEGIVNDPSGAVIVGAAVGATHQGTGQILTTSTDFKGRFRFQAFAPGHYEVKVEHPGFTTFIQKNISLTIGAKFVLPLGLILASKSDSVVVSSLTPMIEATRTSVSTTVDARSVKVLPMNGRNFLSLVALTPGVTELSGYSVFSDQNVLNSLVVDGADHNAFQPSFVRGVTPDRYLISQEAVQELQVNTNSYSAEFGRAGAGVINVVTKSGTNHFHGALFWYYRDRGMNATGIMNKLNDEPKDPLHAHQFGGALGGPLVKNRLFFYANYDGQPPERTEPHISKSSFRLQF